MRTQTHKCKFISQVRAQRGSQGGGEVSVHRPRGLESPGDEGRAQAGDHMMLHSRVHSSCFKQGSEN